MTLSFLHPGIAALGALAIAAPILIHLLMRQQPKPIVLPTMRLLRVRHTPTVKRLKLRQWALMALRALLLLFLGLALARPTLHSSLFSIDQNAPVSAAIVVDVSLSMEYKHQGKSRLRSAMEVGRRLLSELPEGSEAVIIDSATAQPTVALEIPLALARLDSLETQIAPRPLNDAVVVGLKALAKSTNDRRELHVLTDMTAGSFNLSDSDAIKQAASLSDHPAMVYVINVGVAQPENFALSEPRVGDKDVDSTPSASTGSATPRDSSGAKAMSVSVMLTNVGPPVDRTVALSLDGQPRDNRAVHLDTGESADVSFTLAKLAEGFHQGTIEVKTEDPLSFDDLRFFTAMVHRRANVLVITDQSADGLHWSNALSPADAPRNASAGFDVEETSLARLASVDLAPYAMISLLNVGSPTPATWIRLESFVQAGGGLFVALGERVDKISYDSAPAKAVLAGSLVSEARPDNPVVLSPSLMSHPVLAKFKEWGETDLADLPVFRYWKVAPSDGSLVLIPYSNGDPALVERVFGAHQKGKSLLLTTAAHYRAGAGAWSELPLGWSYVALADLIAKHLSNQGDAKVNVAAGEAVSVEVANPGLYAITDGTGNVERLTADPGATLLAVPAPKRLGNYELSSVDAEKPRKSAFSVNEPSSESILTPIPQEKLADLFGNDRFSLASDPSQLDRVMGEGRVGRELFGTLMLLVLVIVSVEGWLANRFYREPTKTEPASR